MNITDNPNVILGMSNADYHARTELSNSQLSLLSISPADYKVGFREETNSMKFGTLFHTALLEPYLLKEQYAVGPEINRNKKEWKDFVLDNSDVICLKQSEMDKVIGPSGAIQKLRENKVTNDIFTGGVAEASVFGELEGVPCRCRPDYLNEVDGRIYCIDLKKTASATNRNIQSSITKYRYHVQSVFYTDVLESAGIFIDAFIFVFIEEKPPHKIRTKTLGYQSLNRGRELYRRDLEVYKKCLESGDWPGYPEDIEEIVICAYGFYDEE